MIVIPMAGLSSRFARAGYRLPKYMLPLGGEPVFDHAVSSFKALFSSQEFLFVARDVDGTAAFIEARADALGIVNWRTVILDGPTRGQAHTVALGAREAGLGGSEPVTVFNIDTFRPGYEFPLSCREADGYLEVFEGEGANWSFVLPEAPGSDRVVRTTEKDPISRFCCTGLYHFAKFSDFLRAFAVQSSLPGERLAGGEVYVAPLYNELIAWRRDVRMNVVSRDDVIFCGVPAEYEALATAT